MTQSNRSQNSQTAAQTRPAVAAALLLSTLALPVSAQFISSDRTIANGNPLSGSYIGQTVRVGASGIVNGVVTRVANVQADVVAPASFVYNDQTGGGLEAYSNSVVRIQGGSFSQNSSTGFGGGVSASDTSTVIVNGGSLRVVSVAGSAAGAAGAHAIINGGLVENGSAIVAYPLNGTLDVNGGTVRATGSQPGIAGVRGSIITVNGGLVQSVQGSAIFISEDSALTMTGGTVTGGPGGGSQWGVRTQGGSQAVNLQGGTVNGGVRTIANLSQPVLQATMGGSLMVNGGVFAHGTSAVNVTGGSYTRFAGADASFFAMGSNTINFFGTGLALSGPTAGSVFETNNYIGNFYTFTSGVFSDGQSAVGLRLFDAVSVAGNLLGGGFTLNPSPVPEPAAWLLMLLALPAVGAVARRRRVSQPAAA